LLEVVATVSAQRVLCRNRRFKCLVGNLAPLIQGNDMESAI
jgi:hypothetical protein